MVSYLLYFSSSSAEPDVEMGSLFSPVAESIVPLDPTILSEKIMDINNSPGSRRARNNVLGPADWWETQLGGTSPTNEPEAVELQEMSRSIQFTEESKIEEPKQEEKKHEEKKRDGKKR
jgi:hypothetical protein